MLPAFFECLVLVGIHSYLGLHVIRRKVIFVDLALAQIAALGTTVGFLFGIMPSTTGAYWFSLTFTFIGAAVFSISRIRHEKIPQEAVIGLTYAIAASVAILVIDKAPHGAEHIKEIMTGSILWVQWETIFNAAIVYSIVGVFHFIFRKQFLLISENPHEAYKKGMNVRFWDFLFYMSFGIVITHSVGTAGVLLVFVFLVVPAIASILITNVLWKQLAIGWGLGLLVSILGLYISYIADLPSGPTVVAFYGVMLILIALFLFIFRAESRKTAGLKIALGVGVTLLIIFGFYIMGSTFKSHYHEHEHHGVINDKEHLLHEITEHKKLTLMNENELDKFLKKYNNVKQLNELFNSEPDKFIKIKIASRISEIDIKPGIKLMLNLLKNCEFPFLREEIIQKMRETSGQNFGFDDDKSYEENMKVFEKWENYLKRMDKNKE
ncbi:MAG: metal ABC transporter permease [Calditrichia bacterium]|nr:metal ABC transporter permease [Calditrichia bacterium]